MSKNQVTIVLSLDFNIHSVLGLRDSGLCFRICQCFVSGLFWETQVSSWVTIIPERSGSHPLPQKSWFHLGDNFSNQNSWMWCTENLHEICTKPLQSRNVCESG